MGALTPWKSKHDLETLRNDMDEMFRRLSEGFLAPWRRGRGVWDVEGWEPSIESHIENGNFVVKADLPGIDPKEVTISVTGNQLTIEGERKREEKKEEKDYFYHELSYGKFSRTLVLPEGADTEKVKADYKNGVLKITVPAPKQVSSKKIPIEAAK
jgi:HSP20 family protein